MELFTKKRKISFVRHYTKHSFLDRLFILLFILLCVLIVMVIKKNNDISRHKKDIFELEKTNKIIDGSNQEIQKLAEEIKQKKQTFSSLKGSILCESKECDILALAHTTQDNQLQLKNYSIQKRKKNKIATKQNNQYHFTGNNQRIVNLMKKIKKSKMIRVKNFSYRNQENKPDLFCTLQYVRFQ